MGRSPCCDESGVKKGPWTPEEDQKLIQYIHNNGHGSWRALPKLAGLNRCGKSCRLRWTNYLRPDTKRGKFSPEEEQTILHLHSIIGNKWSAIATQLPGRTDNEIKNFWNTHLKKKLLRTGIDPTTHQPRTDLFSTLPQLMALASLRELVEHRAWDDHAARLQAEALRLAKLQCCFQCLLQSPATISSTNTNTSSLIHSINSKMDPMSLLNSAQVPTTVPSPSSLLLPLVNCHAQFHHLPEMSCNFQQQPFENYIKQDLTFLNIPPSQEENNELRPALSLSSLPGIADDSLGNGENCSSYSYGGNVAPPPPPPLWPELFDDPLMPELI